MKKIFGIFITLVIITFVAFAALPEIPRQAGFLSAQTIAAAIKKLSSKAELDQPLRTVDAGTANVGVFLVHRPQETDQGCTIEHDTLVNDHTTSVFFVLDGAGTLVLGGKLTNPRPLAADDPDLMLLGSGSRGSGIQDGESRRIAKGDVVIIPAGLAHGFSAIEKSITYQVVRIDSGKVLPIK